MLYWLSWEQPTEDHRPLTYPPNEAILGWWCSGYGANGATLCAMVKAESEDDAFTRIQLDWPEIVSFRFIDVTESTTCSDRFKPSEWMQPRIDAYNAENKADGS